MNLSKREQVFIYVIIALVIGISVQFYYAVISKDIPLTEEYFLTAEEIEGPPVLPNVESSIFIDVKGEVIEPGVYEMKEAMRVYEVIDKAGGYTLAADPTKINLAALLHDEMVLYVPKLGEQVSVTSVDEGSKKININLATQQELDKLPGIGPAKAEAIVVYRQENGPFKTIEQLKNVSGIGEKVYEQIKLEIDVR